MIKKILIMLLCVPLFGISQSWNLVSNFIGDGRHHPITFGNDEYGFVISGSYLDDVHKYDKANDSWVQLQDIPFSGRGYSYGVAVGNKAYIGFGSTSNGQYPVDWWEYDMDNDVWNQKSNFPGVGREHPAMIVVNNKI
jgi:N-acetylneuraminic acid mutarotase